jgi:uncharacterized protein (TIRG00374 family)
VDVLGQRVSGVRVAAGMVLGSAALWLAFRGIGFGDLVRATSAVRPDLTLAALASTCLTLVLGTLRWQLLFYPQHRHRRFHALFRAVIVGQMVNIVSPVRVGEIARLYALAESERVSKTQVLATLALEKVLDLVVFGLAVALLLALMALPDGVRVKTSAQLSVGGAALVGLWLMARYAIAIARRVERWLPRLPPRWRSIAKSTLVRFVDGLGTLRRLHTGGALLALSLAVMTASATTNYLVMLAFDFDVPAWSALFLLVLLQVGSVPPSLPGKIGVFHYLTVIGLAVFGVERSAAFSYSIVLYAVALLPKVVLGVAYVAAGSLSRASEQSA